MLDFSEALMIHMIYNSIQDMKFHDKKYYKNVSLSFMVVLRYFDYCWWLWYYRIISKLFGCIFHFFRFRFMGLHKCIFIKYRRMIVESIKTETSFDRCTRFMKPNNYETFPYLLPLSRYQFKFRWMIVESIKTGTSFDWCTRFMKPNNYGL